MVLDELLYGAVVAKEEVDEVLVVWKKIPPEVAVDE
jgi:hypothetical protein